MPFKNETPLRGWKEILPIMGRGNGSNGLMDKRTARDILRDKGLLTYENGRPVLLVSQYLATFMAKKWQGMYSFVRCLYPFCTPSVSSR